MVEHNIQVIPVLIPVSASSYQSLPPPTLLTLLSGLTEMSSIDVTGAIDLPASPTLGTKYQSDYQSLRKSKPGRGKMVS